MSDNSGGGGGRDAGGAGRREFLKAGAKTAGYTVAALAGLTVLSRNTVSSLTVPEWIKEEEESYNIGGETFEYPFTCETADVNGTEVALIGAGHTLGAFSRYRDFFEAVMEDADALMLERPAGGDFHDDPYFFGQLGMQAKQSELSVYQADPVNMPSTILDLAVGVAGVQGMYGASKSVVTGKNTERVEEAYDEVINGLSRRDFMRNAALFAGGSYLFLGSLFGVSTRTAVDMEMGEDGISEYGMDNRLAWGNTDYRNIVIADGIERVCEEDIDRLVTIHGDLHGGALKGYLEEEAFRDIKEETYLPYELLTERDVEKFVYNGENWEEVYTL